MTIWQKLSAVAHANADDKIYMTDRQWKLLNSTQWSNEHCGDSIGEVVYGLRFIYFVDDYDGAHGILPIPRKLPKDTKLHIVEA